MRTPEEIAQQGLAELREMYSDEAMHEEFDSAEAILVAAIRADREERWNKNHERACNVYGGGPCTCGFSPLRQRVAELEYKLAEKRA